MAWSGKLEGGTIGDFASGLRREWAIDVTAGVTAATKGLQADLRGQVVRADLGRRMSNAVGLRLYPAAGASLGAAGVVFPRGKKAEEIFDGFNTGAVIRAKNGAAYIAIPTRDAGRPGGRRPTPGQIEAQGVKLVPIRTNRADVLVLVGAAPGRRGRRIVYFVLVRQSKERQSLSFEAAAQSWADRIPNLIDGV